LFPSDEIEKDKHFSKQESISKSVVGVGVFVEKFTKKPIKVKKFDTR
jgi:hypothetical protein